MIGSYIAVSIVAFLALVWMLRRDQVSLGLPIAYLALLLLNHLPGAYAHMAADGRLFGDEFIEIGVGYTAIGVICFVLGTGLARVLTARPPPMGSATDRWRFATFCLLGGWFFIFGLTPLQGIPSLGAAILNGGAIWILGVALGLRSALGQGDIGKVVTWSLALLVYPLAVLVIGGFLSYGAAAIITASAGLAVAARSNWRVLAGLVLTVAFSLTLFVNYFESRDAIRLKAWGGASVAERIDANLDIFRDFHLFDPGNLKHLSALDQRLNQNYFVGLSAKRLEGGQVDYLYGRSVSDALLSLVPRAIWPSKPVYGGSPKIVAEMTGIRLNMQTSWGVGQVMEFQINFGLLGVVLGFVGLGALIAWLDLKAAIAEMQGRLGDTIIFFLPGVALIQPVGSMVELSGSAAAALVAAFAWRWAWNQWNIRPPAVPTGRRVPGAARRLP